MCPLAHPRIKSKKWYELIYLGPRELAFEVHQSSDRSTGSKVEFPKCILTLVHALRNAAETIIGTV